MTETPEPKDKLDATTTVVVNGPEDDALRLAPGRLAARGGGRTAVAAADLHGIEGGARRFCPPISHQGLLEPDAGKLARPVCARHDQQLGGASPLWRLMAPTTSRWQLLSREAGWGGSRSAKS